MANRLQDAGYEVYKSLGIPGVDFLVKKNGLEAKVQVKWAGKGEKSSAKNETFGVGATRAGWQHALRMVDWIVVVLPDHRMFLFPKARVRRALSHPRTKRRKHYWSSRGIRIAFGLNNPRFERLVPFEPEKIRLFTEVTIHTHQQASEYAGIIPPALPGYENTGCYFVGINKAEIYIREILKVIRNLYSSSTEDAFIKIVILKIVRNVIHEMTHAADPSIQNEHMINQIAREMTQE